MIENIRKQYPEYSDLSDQELADALHSKYYSDLPKEQFYNKIGLSEPSLLGKIINIPSKVGSTTAEFLMETGPALGEKAVGLTQLGAETLGYQDFSKRLGEITAKEREGLTTTQKIGRTVLGSLPEIAVGGAAFKGMQAITKPSTFGKIASLTGAGIASGATGGITEVRQEGDIKDRLIGTAGRASLEGVLTPATAGVAKMAGKGYNFLKNVFTKGNPEQVAKEALNPIAAKQALEELSKSPAGKPTTGIDIQQPEFQQFSRSVISRYPSSRMIAEDFAKGRNAQALDRINKDLNILSKIDDAETYLAQLDNTKKTLTEPLYQVAKENPKPFPKFEFKVSEVITQPKTTKISQGKTLSEKEIFLEDQGELLSKIKSQSKKVDGVTYRQSEFLKNSNTLNQSLQQQKKIFENQAISIKEGEKQILKRKDITNFDQLSPQEKIIATKYNELQTSKVFNKYQDEARKLLEEDIPDNSLKMLHRIRRRIDASNNANIKDGKILDPDLKEINNNLRNKINDLIKDISPEFREADAIYSKFSSQENAIKEGMNFSSQTPFEIKKSIENLSKFSDLSKKEVIDNYRIGVRDALVKQAQKAVKFEGTNTPTKIQVKSFIESEYKKGQLKTIFPTEQSFNKFVDNVNQEVIYNKVLSDLNLTKASIEQDKTNFIRNAFNYLLSNKLTGYGTTGAVVNASRAGEEILIRNYKNLNEANAKALAKILTNKNASVKLLESVIKNADKTQKEAVSQVVRDIYQPLATSKIITEPAFTE